MQRACRIGKNTLVVCNIFVSIHQRAFYFIFVEQLRCFWFDEFWMKKTCQMKAWKNLSNESKKNCQIQLTDKVQRIKIIILKIK